MRHGVLWTLLLLDLPQVAAADGAIGAAADPLLPGGELAIQSRETPAPTFQPNLDLRIDPPQMPSSQDLLHGAPAIESDWADRYFEEDAADRGLSFGFEVKPRSRIGALARKDETEDSGLEGQLERLIERPVLELRGRYRF